MGSPCIWESWARLQIQKYPPPFPLPLVPPLYLSVFLTQRARSMNDVAWHRAFSYPEAAILLGCTKDPELWPEPIFWACAEYLLWIFSQSDLPDLTMSPWFTDVWSWRRPEVSILGADQKDCGLWGQEWLRRALRAQERCAQTMSANVLKRPDTRCNIACNLTVAPCVHSWNCYAQRCVQLLQHRQLKLTPQESEELIIILGSCLWFDSRVGTWPSRETGIGLQAAVYNLRLCMGNKICIVDFERQIKLNFNIFSVKWIKLTYPLRLCVFFGAYFIILGFLRRFLEAWAWAACDCRSRIGSYFSRRDVGNR